MDSRPLRDRDSCRVRARCDKDFRLMTARGRETIIINKNKNRKKQKYFYGYRLRASIAEPRLQNLTCIWILPPCIWTPVRASGSPADSRHPAIWESWYPGEGGGGNCVFFGIGIDPLFLRRSMRFRGISQILRFRRIRRSIRFAPPRPLPLCRLIARLDLVRKGSGKTRKTQQIQK